MSSAKESVGGALIVKRSLVGIFNILFLGEILAGVQFLKGKHHQNQEEDEHNLKKLDSFVS